MSSGRWQVMTICIFGSVRNSTRGSVALSLSQNSSSLSTPFSNTALALQENGVLKLDEFWDKLKATDPLVEFRTEPKMQMVITCQRPLDMWNLSGRVYQNVLKKPDLAKVLKIGHYSEGQVMLGNQAAVIKGAPHRSAG